jgi:hypothetical protein
MDKVCPQQYRERALSFFDKHLAREGEEGS